MKFTSTSAVATIQRTAEITENHPVIRAQYFTRPTDVRVELLTVTFLWKDGKWKTQHPEVHGLVLKKDGTPGKQRHSRTVPDFYDVSRGAEPWPWAQEIIERLRPHGQALLASYHEEEV